MSVSKPVEIERVLVANRGEIARRIFATCRRLGIGTVAVFSDTDADALYVGEADEAHAIGGAAPSESYLRVPAIIDAARQSHATAVHPGYGFLAENAVFARAVLDAGLIWIGPSPAAIAAMGSKTDARELMERAGVPVLPGRRLKGPEAAGDLTALGAEVGYPLLVKASAGGGGKGMRLVDCAERLPGAVESARREAGKAFGDDTVFLEQYAARSRHVEIQILGDEHGTVVSLGERDCSVQRRHQKVIEESPSPAVDAELRAAMGAAAVAAGNALAYAGAGTVEFLLLAETREFFFLEVNTRLQVEHPVTELVTGLDLVELQILIAEGRHLPPAAREPRFRGHAIEARLYAEDPAHEFLPATGTLVRFGIPGSVRVDTGVRSGSVISPHYDPMIAKVIAHGETRGQAARLLGDALRRAELHGTITNRDFLVRVLGHPEFLAGEADTGFLDRQDPAALARPLLDAEDQQSVAVAAALALQAGRRSGARVLGSLPSGWRNVSGSMQVVAFERPEAEPLHVGYRFDRAGRLAAIRVDGDELDTPVLHACSPQRVDLQLGGRRQAYAVHVDGDLVHVNTPRAQASLRVLPRHPGREQELAAGSLTAPMPGAVLRVLAGVGEQVSGGQALLVIEAMKMEHEIIAPGAGVVSDVRVSEGSQVQAGAILAVIETQEQS